MKLVAIASKTGAVSIRHFNLEQPDGSRHSYSIGAQPVDVLDADAKTILKLSEHVVPFQEVEEPTERVEKRARGRRTEEAPE